MECIIRDDAKNALNISIDTVNALHKKNIIKIRNFCIGYLWFASFVFLMYNDSILRNAKGNALR
jgi:hypothetical protein